MNKITNINLVKSAEGLRIVYSYTSIDDNGNIIKNNQRGNYININSETENFFSKLEKEILEKIE